MGKARTQITKVSDMICVTDFHDLCLQLSPRGSFGGQRNGIWAIWNTLLV